MEKFQSQKDMAKLLIFFGGGISYLVGKEDVFPFSWPKKKMASRPRDFEIRLAGECRSLFQRSP